MKFVSNHDLKLVSLLGDDTINEIRRDLCVEMNLAYCEENFPRVDEIIRKTWTPETLNMINRDIRHETIWKVIKVVSMIPIAFWIKSVSGR
jgi:hypothetical protein